MIWNIVAATLVAAVLRLFRLGAPSLWIDEVFTWYGAEIGRPFSLSSLLENVHGPLYSLMLHFWGGWMGDSEWALRFPSAVAGIATVPLFAWFAARWLGRECAVPMAWLAAGSPFLIWYSQEARNYALLLPCVALAGVAMQGLRERLSAGRLAGFVAASAAGVLTNFSWLLLVPLHLLQWLGTPLERKRRLVVLGMAAALMLVVLSPWLPRLASVWDWKRLHPVGPNPTESLRGGPAISLGAYPFTLHAFAAGYTMGPAIREMRTLGAARALAARKWEIAAVALVFGVLGALAIRAAARRRVLLASAVALLVPALLVSYGAVQNFKVYHPRYVAVSFPFALALVAAALADLKPRARLAAAAALAAVWGLSLYQFWFVPVYGKEDMRSAVAWMEKGLAEGDRIVGAGADDVIIYYYRGPLEVERYWLGWVADSAKMAARLDQSRLGARKLWVLWSRGEDLDPEGRFLHHLKTAFPGADTFESEGVRAWALPGLADSTGGAGPDPSRLLPRPYADSPIQRTGDR